MNCPNCRQTLPANAHFCGACGTQLGMAAMANVATPGVATPGSAGGIGRSGVAPGQAGGIAALLDRVKNILLNPKIEWPVIEPEPTTIVQMYTGYVMPLASVAALLSFVHVSVLGIALPFGGGNLRMPLTSGLTSAVMTFVFGLIGLYLLALIVNALAPSFAGQRDQRQALKVAAYAFTPGYISALLALSPVLPTLLQFIAGCYGIYLLALGLPVLMQSPRDKAFGYTASVVICSILVGMVFAFVSASVMHVTGLGPAFGGTFSAPGATPGQDPGATIVGNVLGNALGTDAQGKAGLGAALSNLVQAGKQQEAAEARQAAVNSNAAAAAGAEASSSAPAASPADGAQNALGAAGGLLTALGGALNGGKRVDAVDYKTLTTLLPASLPGMTRVTAGGESSNTIGIKSSKSTARYTTADGKTAEIEIADLSGVAGLMDLANGLQQSTATESDTGYEKQVVLNGRNAHEKFDRSSGHGQVSVTLAKRYEVTASGNGIAMPVLEQALNSVDLAKLEAMKDQGAHAQ